MFGMERSSVVIGDRSDGDRSDVESSITRRRFKLGMM